MLLDDNADVDDLRTAGAAVHRFDGHWAECAQGSAKLVTTHTARA